MGIADWGMGIASKEELAMFELLLYGFSGLGAAVFLGVVVAVARKALGDKEHRKGSGQ
jgi:hypothetical protein